MMQVIHVIVVKILVEIEMALEEDFYIHRKVHPPTVQPYRADT